MLYLVATPIGNLGDITQRALDTLRAVDLVASEDTRHTGQLLRHFGIRKPQVSFHEHNERRALPRLMAVLAEGRDVALVTDAGTPGISDPGYSLVRAAIDAGCGVTMVPGATAAIMAVVLSGLPTHSFTFRGFPPHRGGPGAGSWPSTGSLRTRSSTTRARTGSWRSSRTLWPSSVTGPPPSRAS